MRVELRGHVARECARTAEIDADALVDNTEPVVRVRRSSYTADTYRQVGGTSTICIRAAVGELVERGSAGRNGPGYGELRGVGGRRSGWPLKGGSVE